MWKVSCAQSSLGAFFFWLGVLTVCMREKSALLLVVLTNVLPERPNFLFMFTNTFLESIEKGFFSYLILPISFVFR